MMHALQKMVTQLKSQTEFNSFIGGNDLSLVHFHAEWNPSCSQLNQVLDDLALEVKTAFRWAYIEAEAVPEVTKAQRVTSAPVVVFYKNGQEVDRVGGFNPIEIRQKLTNQSFKGAAAAGDHTKAAAEKEPLNVRLEKLVKHARVMLFMKGNREAPRCGFSRQVIEILNGLNVDYQTFDILSNEEVRQGLKEYSNWPTYPQLYLDGELIGGLDVIKEELKDGDLATQLPKKA